MRPLKIVLLVLGTLIALTGLGVLVGGLVLGWAYGTQRDDDGFFTTRTERFTSDAYAITSEGFEVLTEPETPAFIEDNIGEVLLRASSPTDPVFIGIGPEREVEAYLDGVAHDEIRDLDVDPFDVDYRRQPGTEAPAAPTAQTFWVAQASGPGTQTVTWEIEPGRWMVVLMNADGSQGVAADVQVGGQTDLLPLAIALLLGGGAVLVLLGTAIIVWGAVGLGEGGAAAAMPLAGPIATEAHPVRLEGRLDEPLSRWLWIFKWLLAIPHFIILAFLGLAFVLLTFVAGLAILFTGRYPRGIFDFNLGVLRWGWRVAYYATSAIGTDRYPPFTLGPVPDYPATLDVVYPAQLSRGLVLVKWWLLAIPHYIVLAAFSSGPATAAWEGDGDRTASAGISLTLILVLVAGFSLLFRARYPLGVHAFLMGINRWSVRVIAYAGLMTDSYPPFRLDQGATEPVDRVEPVSPAAPASDAGPAPA